MRELYEKIQSSELLTESELLRLKVTVVMVFLLIFGIWTIPVSFFEDFDLILRIMLPVGFIVLFLVTFLLLFFGQSRLAMHFSIFTFIGLTVYYVGVPTHFYGYLLIFVSLTIIIFYQDISTYIVYGGALTIFGVYYVQTNPEAISTVELAYPILTPLVYQLILVAFFLSFVVYFILLEITKEKLSEEYAKTRKLTERYQSLTIRQTGDLDYSLNLTPLHEDATFEYSVKELADLLYNKVQEDEEHIELDASVDFSELVEFYLFLHGKSIENIVNRSDISELSIKYAQELEKYLLDRNSELQEIIQDFCAYRLPCSPLLHKRYSVHFDTLFKSRTNRILALCALYRFMRAETTQFDKWGRVEKLLSHSEVKYWFQYKVTRDYLSFEDMNFFLQNETLFKEYLF